MTYCQWQLQGGIFCARKVHKGEERMEISTRYFMTSSTICAFLAQKYNCIGRSRGFAAPIGTQFFHFRISFCQKAPVSEVGAPFQQNHPPSQTGNPGSALSWKRLKDENLFQKVLNMKLHYLQPWH